MIERNRSIAWAHAVRKKIHALQKILNFNSKRSLLQIDSLHIASSVIARTAMTTTTTMMATTKNKLLISAQTGTYVVSYDRLKFVHSETKRWRGIRGEASNFRQLEILIAEVKLAETN